jgi:diguanylate cyclase (GGDEF)-like protein
LENSLEPGKPTPHTDVGTNYMAVFRANAGSSAKGAEVAHQGIQAVLEGTLPSFSMDYPCHSVDQRRWFTMRVSPVRGHRSGAVIAHTNITERVLANEALQRSENRLSSMTAAVPDVVYQFSRTPDGDWKFLYLSKGIEDLYEITAEDAYRDHRVLTECIIPEDRESHREAVERSATSLSYWQHEHRIRTASGKLKWVLGKAIPELQADRSVLWNGILANVTESKEAKLQLETVQDRLQLALSGGELGLWDWNIPSGEVLYSEQWFLMLGLPKGDTKLNLDNWVKLIHPDDLASVNAALEAHLKGQTPTYECEHRVRHQDGRWLWLLDRGRVVDWDKVGAPLRAVGTYFDITERKRMENHIRQLAFHDSLTQLPNRRLLRDRLTQAMATNKRSGCHGALMFLDLDNFKPLNDAHGHEFGDLLLIEVANRLKACVREMDTVARVGGDEFVVMLSELVVDRNDSTVQARNLAEKIRTALSEPYLLSIKRHGMADTTVTHLCTTSIGVALFFNHEASPDDVLKWADAGMYQAKQSGRNAVRFYDPKI